MTTIEYKGKVTNVEPGHSAVIRCEGFEMQDEVVVTAGHGGSSSGVPIELTSEEEFNAIVANPARNVGKIFRYNGELFTIVQESDA